MTSKRVSEMTDAEIRQLANAEPRWGIIHPGGYQETNELVTTREGARQWAAEEDEDCDCGGKHRVFSVSPATIYRWTSDE
jgi:hypothetical protein